ncbi:hypothetical protein MRY87_07315 [bacterium]|nr:hypothetical protein [bacterium]
MEIYRYFHPHHNPRLFRTPLRRQEVGELHQASSELRKAIERARLRTERSSSESLSPQLFDDALNAVRVLESSLKSLRDLHEGDSTSAVQSLVEEREGLKGWESWARIVAEQLEAEEPTDRENPEHLLTGTLPPELHLKRE